VNSSRLDEVQILSDRFGTTKSFWKKAPLRRRLPVNVGRCWNILMKLYSSLTDQSGAKAYSPPKPATTRWRG